MSKRWPNAGLTVEAMHAHGRNRWGVVMEDTGDCLNKRLTDLASACRLADRLERDIKADMVRLGIETL